MAATTGRMKAHWFHILLALAGEDRYGTSVMDDVFERTNGALKLWPGKLYGSLQELADLGWISEVEAPPDAPADRGKRRFYGITSAGRRALSTEVEHLDGFVRLARKRLTARG